jgi:peptidoglycan/xylan/chitin deacetylase (PgdA/CDA1 family)/SAM-dependent methyltransferase
MTGSPAQALLPRISVIVPAHQAEDTLDETLRSLLAQTMSDWEAIIVENGSSDGTAGVAGSYAAADARMHLIRCERLGEGGARNAGLASAAAEWLLFLDADDWLTPDALERLLAGTSTDRDVVYADWGRVAQDGSILPESSPPAEADMREVTARCCPFAVHSALARASLVRAVGGFDSAMSVCADWDFWQRMTWAGARFSRVPGSVAFYRMRPRSAGNDVSALLANGLALIDRAHDQLRADHDEGQRQGGVPARRRRSAARLSFVSWPAGMVIGAEGDPRTVLDAVLADEDPEMDAHAIASQIFRAALIPDARVPSEWIARWSTWAPLARTYLDALEQQSGSVTLRARAERWLERLVLERRQPDAHDITIGRTHAVVVDVSHPVTDIRPPAGCDRLLVRVEADGASVGELRLPICDGLLPEAQLRDAIAGMFAWPLLGVYLQHTVFPELRPTDGSDDIQRGTLTLGSATDSSSAALHQAFGWTLLLHELWQIRDRGREWFETDGELPAAAAATRFIDAGPEIPCIEMSAPLPELHTSQSAVDLALAVAGRPIAVRRLHPDGNGRITPAALLRACACIGFELCIAVVRDGVIGWPLDAELPLRTRLGHRATLSVTVESAAPAPAGAVRLVEGWRAIAGMTLDGADGVVLARREPLRSGGSQGRMGRLPGAARDSVLQAAAALGELALQSGRGGSVAYEPALLWSAADIGAPTQRGAGGAAAGSAPRNRVFDRHHFESVFLSQRDPWRYATEFERRKYEHTLELIEPASRALELACAEGMFTELLAGRVEQLIATDIAQTAVERTAATCARFGHVAVAQLDFRSDSLGGPHDLIVCSEAFYYLDGVEELRMVGERIADALRPGGVFVTAHSNVLVDDAESPGLDWDVPFGALGIARQLSRVRALTFECELRTPLYRIQRFRRRRLSLPLRRSKQAPRTVIEREHLPPAPEVAARFRPRGQVTRGRRPLAETWRLPILTFHQVAPGGSPEFARYRVDPAAFEERLRYLRDCGFHSVSLPEWRDAQTEWRPLQGRAIVLTFDDATADFAEHAWPLLKEYGFGAYVFPVTGFAGATNSWDAAGYGEQTPLLDWNALRRLARDGVLMGSHTHSHAHLLALDPGQTARELVDSRAAIARELGVAVDAIAYPHGSEDEGVHALAAASGYEFGLTCRPGRNDLHQPLLALHRIEVRGDESLRDLIAALAEA